MSKILLGSFAAIAVTVVGLMDYTMQSRRADLPFGTLGLGDYAATMTTRFTDMKSEQAAAAETGSLRRQELRTLLPEAAEGWVMREWNEGDRARLFPPLNPEVDPADVPEEFAEFQEHMNNDPMMRQLREATERAAIAKEKAEIRFYQRGDSLIALQLDFNRIVTGGMSLNGAIAGSDMQNAAMNIIVGNMTAMSGRDGFAVIGGVPYGQSYGLLNFDDSEADPATTPRTFRGAMGGEVTITARALASDADVTDLLAQIDYDTLNKLLTTPLEGVGSDAPQIAPENSQAIADAAVEAEAEAVIARGRQSEADMRGLGEDIRAVTDAVQGDAPAQSGGILGMFLNRSAAAQADAAPEPDTAPPEGSLAALMAPPAPAPAPEPAAEAAPEPAPVAATPAPAAPQVRVRRAGSVGTENCENTGVGKRCSLLGD